MGFYSPEPAIWRDGGKLTNGGRRHVGKSPKPVPRTFDLRILLGQLYTVGDSEVDRRLFDPKYDSEIRYGCGTLKLMRYSC